MKTITVDNLVKTYKTSKQSVEALKGVSLAVNSGELFGLIGPDGAGKTTLIRILVTLLVADSGSAWVDELEVVKDYKIIRQRVGYMPGTFSLYQDLTVQENLDFFATVFETFIEENYDLVKDIYIQIEPFKNRRAGKLSGGMKQKLALCCALIHKPTVLFLDEPTTGVDAVSRKEFWDMLANLKQQGITTLVSTPYMDEASMCDRVALIQEGTILAIDTPQTINQQFNNPLLAVASTHMFPLLNDLKTYDQATATYPFGEYHHVVMQPGYDPIRLEKYLQDKKHSGLEIKVVSPTIEDSFIQLMSKNRS
ncbi:ABC transporter ATP-binding protein [Adhaeribacter radiodurans]|uniref:ABC transporter ATP-binding protein n=1 Tax=Adhaeribacter radiodurans TaxID=2745197 RepID=A0A7L7L5C8_9BACT|nr:ABC transporter ATP-binding protein [Adhaeribacter radiodurans]QMU28011.1 ABC transporter ATP-binding protein [Adhaeribacter radiodurans]